MQPEQGRTGRLIQVQQLVHIFDKNGAVTEASQTLDDFNNEKSSEEDSSKLLQPLSDSQREDLDVLALLDRIRRLATTNWRESLAQLTTLVSTVDTNTFVTSSSFNITSTMMSQFKVKATELVLDIYNSYIPISKSYLNVVAGILHSTTSSPDSAGISSNEALVSRIVDFLRALVDSYNSFDVNKILGFSTMDSQVVLQTFHKLINPSQQKNSSTISRVRENLVTQTLLGLIPKLGQGLCLREKYSFVNGAGVAFLKASRTNLPMDYKSTEQCNMKQPTSKRARFCSNDALPEVTVNFSLALFERYLWWNCANETEGTESYCSGICLTSAQYSQDLLWQGTPYTSQLKSPLFQLYLLNPHNGSVLEVSSTATESQTRVTRNSELASDQLDITFPILASYSNASNLHCAYWNVTSRLWISKLGFSGETTERNGTVTDKLCHFRTSLGSFFTVLERCPDGYYGEACLQGKRSYTLLCVRDVLTYMPNKLWSIMQCVQRGCGEKSAEGHVTATTEETAHQ